jgi:hypothetical protein
MGTGLGLNVSHTTSHVIKWDRTTTTTITQQTRREKKNKKNDVMLLCPAYCVSRFVLSSFFLPAFVSEILLGHASDAIQFSISTFTTNAPTFLTYSIYNRRVIYICIWPAFVMDHRYPSPVGAAAKEKNFFFF